MFTVILPFKMLTVAAKLLAVSSVHKLLAHYVSPSSIQLVVATTLYNSYSFNQISLIYP